MEKRKRKWLLVQIQVTINVVIINNASEWEVINGTYLLTLKNDKNLALLPTANSSGLTTGFLMSIQNYKSFRKDVL